MERDVMWNAWTGEGLEHLRLTQDGGGVVTDSVIIGAENGAPFRIRYVIRCDVKWRVQNLRMSSFTGDGEEFEMFADGKAIGSWLPGIPCLPCKVVPTSISPQRLLLIRCRSDAYSGVHEY